MKLALVLLLISSIPAAAELVLSQAYYRETNASLHLFVQNKGSKSMALLPPIVNGFDCEALSSRDENRPRDILWYRIRPRTIAPGEIANIMIVLPEPTDQSAVVEIRTSSGESIKTTIKCVPEPMRFQAIRFSRDLRSINVFVRWADASKASSLKRIRLNGDDVRKQASPWPANGSDGLAFTRIALPQPLVKNSFHVLEVEDDAGRSTAYQIRAIPSEFLIGIYGAAHQQNIEDWAAHDCDHHISFHAVPPDIVDALAVSGMTVGPKYITEPLVIRDEEKVGIFDENAARETLAEVIDRPNILYHHLVDEPDVCDYYAGRWLGSTGMELAARAEFFEKHDPKTYNFVQLDNTFWPRNYRVYGESADLLATHRYTLGNFIRVEAGPEAYHRPPVLQDMLDVMSKFRPTTEPRPYFMVTQFFNLGPRRSGRPPDIEEMRLQCYAMIADGASGVMHYIHSGSSGGGEGSRTPELWDAMTGFHKELRRVGEVVESGSIVPEAWVRSDSPHVIAKGIVSADEMAVVLINRSHRSALGNFTVRPVLNQTVSVQLPPWLKASSLDLISAEGDHLKPEIAGQEIRFTVDELRVARAFLLKRR